MKARIYTKEIMDQVYEKNSWLYWKETKNYNAIKDSLAGSLNKKSGYYVVCIDGKQYFNHRILYQFYNNEILDPNYFIDHINRNKTDNRKENLVKGTKQENCCNRKASKNNLSTKHKNIYIIKNKSGNKYYYISIMYNNKIGFSKCYRMDKFTLEDVIKIRNIELERLHGKKACLD